VCVIIISVNSLLDEDSKFLFKNLQNFRIQPIILYLTKNENCPNIEDLYKIITDLCFYDKRNLYAFRYPTNDIDKIMIKNKLMNFIYYYHEWDSLPSINEDIFNILILGESGSGKSSFINQFLQEKKAKEMTGKIAKYFHPKYPITIFDTPGDLSYKGIINEIGENNIDLILFFITSRNIDLLNSKIQLIKEIIRKNKEIVIIYNTFGIDENENTIKNILRQVNSNKIIDNIIKINLKQYIEEKDNKEDNHCNYKINKCYGMDSLFNYIYEIFKPYIINVFNLEYQNLKYEKIDINSFKYWERIKSICNKNNNLKTNAIKIILSYSTKSFFKNKKETLKK
jgi:predicted GTPase